MRQRTLKRHVHSLLREKTLETALSELEAMPASSLLMPLYSGICSLDETLKWHSITALGRTVSRLARQDMEEGRVIMRRLMWTLNDESGGIGWGVPESFGEIIACHTELATEYAHILVSFMREDGFFLEYEPLQQGLMWGLGRAAQTRRKLLLDKKVIDYQLPYLNSPDSAVRGFCAWGLGNLKATEALTGLQQLLAQDIPLRLYEKQRIHATTVGELAARAIAEIKRQPVH